MQKYYICSVIKNQLDTRSDASINKYLIILQAETDFAKAKIQTIICYIQNNIYINKDEYL